jgi:hypothetical protein
MVFTEKLLFVFGEGVRGPVGATGFGGAVPGALRHRLAFDLVRVSGIGES